MLAVRGGGPLSFRAKLTASVSGEKASTRAGAAHWVRSHGLVPFREQKWLYDYVKDRICVQHRLTLSVDTCRVGKRHGVMLLTVPCYGASFVINMH